MLELQNYYRSNLLNLRILLNLSAHKRGNSSVRHKKLLPFLISENMWPRGCVLDCQMGRNRAMCGSNGRLYKSLCAFQRAQCINTQLRLVPRTQYIRTLILYKKMKHNEPSAHNSGGHVSPAAAVFVPECHPDGHFLPVQCHSQTGYCWCSTPDGKPVIFSGFSWRDTGCIPARHTYRNHSTCQYSKNVSLSNFHSTLP
uniref:Thyroglobulin type-1 domain-containing protein n=1 Tax=Dicentrarchus labrax TaxID=13489 RepID=A0A8P4GMB9_DICLA